MDSNTLKQQQYAAIQRRDMLNQQIPSLQAELNQVVQLISQLDKDIATAQSVEKQNANAQSYNNRIPPNNPNPVI